MGGGGDDSSSSNMEFININNVTKFNLIIENL